MRASNTTLKKILSLLPLLIMIYIIFFFSGQNGESSGGLSHKVSLWFITTVNTVFHRGQTTDQILKLTDFWEFYVRKAAHVTEYAILTFTVFLPIQQFTVRYRKNLATETSIYALSKINKKGKYHMESSSALNVWEKLFLTVPASILLASLDEVHQYFVPGRCGIITDVWIDSIGIAFTTLVILIVYMIQSLARANSIHSSRLNG